MRMTPKIMRMTQKIMMTLKMRMTSKIKNATKLDWNIYCKDHYCAHEYCLAQIGMQQGIFKLCHRRALPAQTNNI